MKVEHRQGFYSGDMSFPNILNGQIGCQPSSNFDLYFKFTCPFAQRCKLPIGNFLK